MNSRSGSIIARFATDKMIQDHAPGAGYGTGAVVSEDQQKTIGLTANENVIRVLYLAEKQPVPDTLSYTVDYLEQGTNKKLADPQSCQECRPASCRHFRRRCGQRDK